MAYDQRLADTERQLDAYKRAWSALRSEYWREFQIDGFRSVSNASAIVHRMDCVANRHALAGNMASIEDNDSQTETS